MEARPRISAWNAEKTLRCDGVIDRFFVLQRCFFSLPAATEKVPRKSNKIRRMTRVSITKVLPEVGCIYSLAVLAQDLATMLKV